MSSRGVDAAIRKAIRFIQSAQLPDGSFTSFLSPTISPFKPANEYSTVFTPAQILAALSGVESRPAMAVRRKLAAWLVGQKSANWSYNYWSLAAPEYQSAPYPDDLDDTFCVLIALAKHDRSLISEECLGNVVKLLIATESRVGGPYRTWLVPDSAADSWKDIDLAVNSNIAYFLGLVADPLPNLDALMENAIQSRQFQSPYYPSLPVLYFLSRAYQGPLQPDLADCIMASRRGSDWGNPLHNALAVSALINLGEAKSCQTAVRAILDQQNSDGSWPAEAFWIDPVGDKQKRYMGSAALTTAFVVEALHKFVEEEVQSTTPDRRISADNTANSLHGQIIAAAARELRTLRPELKRQALGTLKQTDQRDDGHEIVLLPYLFNKSLANPIAGDSKPTLISLGLANLYGWMAYTIYDDFLDNEGSPHLLSVANTALRQSVGHFKQSRAADEAFSELVDQTFDAIDGANAWEQAHCRMAVAGNSITIGELPSYPVALGLADRSLGHALTPCAVLAAAGVEANDPRSTLVRRALRHYLVARQLNDDLHDWEQDIRAGIITYVVAAILRGLSIAPGKYRLSKLVSSMRRQFWHHTLVDVCQTITKHTSLARDAARSSKLLAQVNIITTLVNRIDASVKETLTEQAKAEKFLAAYRETKTSGDLAPGGHPRPDNLSKHSAKI